MAFACAGVRSRVLFYTFPLLFRHIAIEGPPGVGKTALAERLGARLDATVVLDERDNPFLADFYQDRPGAAFQAQLFFTLSRYQQQGTLRQSDLFAQLMVCNYLFDRDKIYAYVNLDDNELFIYQRLYELLAPDVRPPDLVIYLQTPVDVVRRRLRERARTDPAAPALEADRRSGRRADAELTHEVVEVVRRNARRPPPGVLVLPEGLRRVADRLPAVAEQPPRVGDFRPGAAQVEDGIERVGGPMLEPRPRVVIGRPGHRDPPRRQHAAFERLLARQGLGLAK